MREGVVVADREARLLVFNPAAEQILGPGSGHRGRRPLEPPATTVYRPDRATPYGGRRPAPVPGHPRRVARPGRDLHRPPQLCRTGRGCSSTPVPCGMTGARSRAASSSSTTSPGGRTTSGGWRSSTPTTRVLAEVDSLERGDSADPGDHRPSGSTGTSAPSGGSTTATTSSAASRMWHAAGAPFPGSRSRPGQADFAPGVGLPGRVWATRKAALDRRSLPRPQLPAVGPRRRGRPALRLRASPILVRGECLGVARVLQPRGRAARRRSCSR